MEANNVKAMREALANSNGLLEELALIGEWGESAQEQIAENNAALAKPLRNCDRYLTQPELSRAYEKYRRNIMKNYGNGLTGEVPTVKQKPMTYDEWLVAPATAKEGGEK